MEIEDFGAVLVKAWTEEVIVSKMFNFSISLDACRSALVDWDKAIKANSSKAIIDIKHHLRILSFHSSTIQRKQASQILKFEDSRGVWLDFERGYN
ncbi:conserved hypothetical protein [Ricinus communis]|uniref:Uncharacterized protein n=1 Tax=Ricinus communis TaxID=3988 RepID=B9T3A1_RICCO|nr:conserved hypothetical protein [Ricinus communis]